MAVLLRCRLWGISRGVFGEEAANAAVTGTQRVDVIIVSISQVYFVDAFDTEVAGHVLLFILDAKKLSVGTPEGIVIAALTQCIDLARGNVHADNHLFEKPIHIDHVVHGFSDLGC